jgi:hypothetical protein
MDRIGNENKGNTKKRTGVHSAALALSCFTHKPNAFLRLYSDAKTGEQQ